MCIRDSDWNSQEAWRMYRLGTTYLALETLISPLTNTNWSNLIQHDVKERVEQFYTYLAGDKKEREKVFFGKGPIVGTIGGPFVSDLITIGNVLGFMKMEKGDFLSYMAGYQDYATRTKDEKIFEIVRTLNTQSGRFLYSTLPKMINGTGIMTLAGQELGLYTSPELAKRKAGILKTARTPFPAGVQEYLTPLDELKSKRNRFKSVMKGQTQSERIEDMYSNTDIQALMASLSELKPD